MCSVYVIANWFWLFVQTGVNIMAYRSRIARHLLQCGSTASTSRVHRVSTHRSSPLEGEYGSTGDDSNYSDPHTGLLDRGGIEDGDGDRAAVPLTQF